MRPLLESYRIISKAISAEVCRPFCSSFINKFLEYLKISTHKDVLQKNIIVKTIKEI